MTAILEREIKLRFDDAGRARAAVLADRRGAARGRRLQEDYLLDTADGTVAAAPLGAARPDGDRAGALLTFKGPVQPSPMKLRDELETMVGDGPLLVRILEELGFRSGFDIEKYREEFALDDVIVAVDETPVGTFVEIEGSDRGHRGHGTALGRGPSDYLLDSYRSLFVRALRAARTAGHRHAVRRHSE